MKYIIDVPSDLYAVCKTLRVPVKVGNGDLSWYNTYIKAEPYTEPDLNPLVDEAVETIENEVWEFVRKIECMTVGELEECFEVDYNGVPFVANAFTFDEAKAKYDAWKKQKEEIRVGDEVVDTETDKGIVTYIRGYLCDVLWDDGGVTEEVEKEELYKTGRHFDEVEELLKKMRGSDD